jgi:hypothetical protein
MCQDSGVLATGGSNGHPLAPLKELVGHNGVMDLLLEDDEEAFLADWHLILGSLDTSISLVAEFASHFDFNSKENKMI